MSSGSYFPPAVKAVPIPKKSGGERVLGVPTVGDRIAQTAVTLRLEPELERVFHDDSYGYRPGRSAHDALAATRKRCWERDWVLEYDIRGSVRQHRSRTASESTSEALRRALGSRAGGALADGADARSGRERASENTGHATGRPLVSRAREPVPALRVGPVAGDDPSERALLSLCR